MLVGFHLKISKIACLTIKFSNIHQHFSSKVPFYWRKWSKLSIFTQPSSLWISFLRILDPKILTFCGLWICCWLLSMPQYWTLIFFTKDFYNFKNICTSIYVDPYVNMWSFSSIFTGPTRVPGLFIKASTKYTFNFRFLSSLVSF